MRKGGGHAGRWLVGEARDGGGIPEQRPPLEAGQTPPQMPAQLRDLSSHLALGLWLSPISDRRSIESWRRFSPQHAPQRRPPIAHPPWGEAKRLRLKIIPGVKVRLGLGRDRRICTTPAHTVGSSSRGRCLSTFERVLCAPLADLCRVQIEVRGGQEVGPLDTRGHTNAPLVTHLSPALADGVMAHVAMIDRQDVREMERRR